MASMNKLGAVWTVLLGSAFLLCACGEEQPDVPDKSYIGVAYYNQSDTFLNELLDSFKEQLKEMQNEDMDTVVMVRDAAGVQRTQDDQVKELINAGCDVLCVNLVDRADPSEIIDMAREHEVPIIFFNREPVAEDLMQWDQIYYVGADAEESGVMQGELAADMIKNNSQTDRNRDGKIQYVVLEGEPGHQDAIIRTETAVKTLTDSGIELEKLSYQIANWNRAQAENRMEQLIGQYPNQIELVLSNNDDMALGAMDAYKKLNYTETALPVFFGIDGTDAGLEAVMDSELAGTVYNDKEGQAKAMAELCWALITGDGMEELEFQKERCIYLPYAKVTEENADEFIARSNTP
ncbi:galactose ABC transporter substrate-binding protein [Lachnoclostridium sp. An196]|uniref:galactose ABC transporter substrate-binding protein n=1 Tax=Lachnoclostridium sp. An196 TaxID=1965583 RepID=UPI000B579593|nr:galactose ABC transporter substrate-binding protein [Lachnoclostridium sp. An196]